MGQTNRFTLVIGTKNLSSWSLRPWVVMKEFDIPFQEVEIPLHTPEFEKDVTLYSPSGRVPVLMDGNLKIWDSLAICEYLNEQFPKTGLWPKAPEARAVARSVSAEMHSGFMNLRSSMPMNVLGSFPGREMKPGVGDDIGRIREIWGDCRDRFGKGGSFLFGAFTIADAIFAPVVFRFRTYGVTLAGAAAIYSKKILDLPSIKEWERDSHHSTQTSEASDGDGKKR